MFTTIKGLEKHIRLTSALFSIKFLIIKKNIFGISIEKHYKLSIHFAISSCIFWINIRNSYNIVHSQMAYSESWQGYGSSRKL